MFQCDIFIHFFFSTCLGDPEWCNSVDCSSPDAKKSCPKTCLEPEWCKFANCSTQGALKACKTSCQTTGNYYTKMAGY